MELYNLGKEFKSILSFIIEQTASGALRELGSQFLKIIQVRLGKERYELEEAVHNPQLLDQLEAKVVETASADSSFKSDLENLIEKINQEWQNNAKSYQTNNSSFSQQINKNLGTTIGQQNIGQQNNFRK